MTNLNTKKKGFTLVELVIVIVIIGILAAIAGMAYANVTQSSKDAVAKANLRSIKSALMMYSAENQGSFPDTLNVDGVTKLLEPQVKKFITDGGEGAGKTGYTISWDKTNAVLKITGGALKADQEGETQYTLK